MRIPTTPPTPCSSHSPPARPLPPARRLPATQKHTQHNTIAQHTQNQIKQLYNNKSTHCAIAQALGDADGALAAYACALSLKPDFPDAHNNLGALHRAPRACGPGRVRGSPGPFRGCAVPLPSERLLCGPGAGRLAAALPACAQPRACALRSSQPSTLSHLSRILARSPHPFPFLPKKPSPPTSPLPTHKRPRALLNF